LFLSNNGIQECWHSGPEYVFISLSPSSNGLSGRSVGSTTAPKPRSPGVLLLC
jgi:hypothetical protein